ncbi:MAG: tRNA (adenosine(37)-N6)-dimethylallyltransferase MiaA, partial [Bacteroidetes bacterium]|nr:tRNA (adenosine(37)-N6)-dimethylallyltransferase MiaA [Candidatus Pullibacteroides excrementavium]
RIGQRLDARLQAGMVQEVQGLLNRGLKPEQLLYYGLEYKFITRYILGELSFEEMREQLYFAICQFAKRQRTWFRKMEREGYRIEWLDGNLSLEAKTALVLGKFPAWL